MVQPCKGNDKHLGAHDTVVDSPRAALRGGCPGYSLTGSKQVCTTGSPPGLDGWMSRLFGSCRLRLSFLPPLEPLGCVRRHRPRHRQSGWSRVGSRSLCQLPLHHSVGWGCHLVVAGVGSLPEETTLVKRHLAGFL